MTIIQPILVLALLLILVVYLRYLRSTLADRLIALTVFSAALLSILFPEATNEVAHAMGIGRGADLYLYLFALGTVFCLIMVFSKLKHLEHVQTKLIRHAALLRPKSKLQNEQIES
jgi:hypothetical protein